MREKQQAHDNCTSDCQATKSALDAAMKATEKARKHAETAAKRKSALKKAIEYVKKLFDNVKNGRKTGSTENDGDGDSSNDEETQSGETLLCEAGAERCADACAAFEPSLTEASGILSADAGSSRLICDSASAAVGPERVPGESQPLPADPEEITSELTNCLAKKDILAQRTFANSCSSRILCENDQRFTVGSGGLGCSCRSAAELPPITAHSQHLRCQAVILCEADGPCSCKVPTGLLSGDTVRGEMVVLPKADEKTIILFDPSID